ncbi:MAG: alpha/beta fold hydrolase [Lachnospiraceae bacterium]|nr:alpha/beta fold hydrolase [Lachnospiraceae bacterium]
MKQEFYYHSKDGLTQIHAIEWIPETEVREVLQIAHGMVEFIDRYDRFAAFMASQGFYVVGNDHLGHGKSVTDESQLGYFARHDGNFCVLGDMQQLREDTRKKYPDVPYFLLGHSMGSFLARQFIEKFGEGLSGAIIMGTGYQTNATLDLAIGLTAVFQRARGGHYRSTTINNMALGSYNASFEPGRTKCDWLTKDEAIVDAYAANPLNQFVFTVNGYYNMFRGMRYCQRKENLNKIPKDLPILVVSGQNDPVGEFGKGPKIVAESYRETGIRDVTLKLFPDDRHEILNELDKEDVDQYLLNWIENHM